MKKARKLKMNELKALIKEELSSNQGIKTVSDPDDLSSIKRDAINTVENNAGPMQVEDLIELAEVLIDALTADDHQKKDGWAAVKQLYWDDYGATYDDDQDHWDKMRR